MEPAFIPEHILKELEENREKKRKEKNSAKLWDESGNWIGTFVTLEPTINLDGNINKQEEKYMNAHDFYVNCNTTK
jgi:hypothetical protein